MPIQSFVSEKELKQLKGLSILNQVSNSTEVEPVLGADFSNWLSHRLLEKLSTKSEFEASGPIALGSFARKELCPRSDIDILFVGDQAAAKQVITWVQDQGMKLRHRIPEDSKNWMIGVEAFDVLAILDGRPLFPSWQTQLLAQQELIHSRGKDFLKALMKVMKTERAARALRYDNLANYLEPNIKYGPGGLRDLQQALAIHKLFPDRFENEPHALEVLKHNKFLFLSIRQKLHLLMNTDVLVGAEQEEIALAFGYTETKDFMRDIQIGLSRVSFYADWTFSRASLSNKKTLHYRNIKLETPLDILNALIEDPSIHVQGEVRTKIDKIFRKRPKLTAAQHKKILLKLIDLKQPEAFFIAVFRSRLLEFVVPEFSKVIGLVQHDHYHKLTVDAHLFQALREVKRSYDQPKRLGRLALAAKSLNEIDWRILALTALFHDLAKGRGGEHSKKGMDLVKKHFIKLGISLRDTVEVAWMVKNHLLLSTAAFRMNPQEPSTWEALHEKGVRNKRIERLAIFTTIDIKATNPEAWTPWKERLLSEIIAFLKAPKATKFLKLLDLAEENQVKLSKEFIAGIDPVVVEELPVRHFLDDYQALQKGQLDLSVKVVQSSRGNTWIRFHQRQDSPGTFLRFVEKMYLAGLPVRMASVHTIDRYGVYDWFKVKNKSKKPNQLKKIFKLTENQEFKYQSVCFDSVTLVSQNDEEVILSFRGKDQKGALMTAAKMLYGLNLDIRWAKVLTWGKQIDDVFAVELNQDLALVLKKLGLKLGQEVIVT